MKSNTNISEQENYQDNVDEFIGTVFNSKRVTKVNNSRAQMEEFNPCDETIGYIQIVDEYDNVDKYKNIPRFAEYNYVKERRVNLPNFTVKGNPFHPEQNGHKRASPELTIEINGLHLITHQESVKNGSQHKIEATAAGNHAHHHHHHSNHQQNQQQQQNGVAATANGDQKNQLDPDQFMSRGHKQSESNYQDSVQEDNVDNEIIFQIADQIPELLERSEMRDACLTPSVVYELKQQQNSTKIQEKKSEFAKGKSFQKETNEKEEEEERMNQQNKVDAKSGMIQFSANDLLQMQLEQQQKLEREREENEQTKLMEGYESDPPLPPEDKNVIYTLVKKEFEFHKRRISKQMIFEIVRDFKPIQAKDEHRCKSSHSDGGKECQDKKIKECLRGIGKEIISQVGRKILTGNFNLTQISFPIKAMIPKSALEKALYSTCLFPLYINKACQTPNLVERFKYLICATLGNFYINCGFLKPLNPIIGETCTGFYPDGTRLYAEQISHHPPISYFSIYGPDKSYLMYGNYNYKSNAGLNSLKLKNNGTRHIKFKDGQYIEYNFAKEVYSGSFMGAMRVESKGVITFKDTTNNIVAEISIDSVKKRPTDYISGTIKVNNQVVSKCYGTYLGFIEFDDIRYWDYRYVLPYEPIIINSKLGSDQGVRPDKLYLIKGDIPKAQKFKEELEELQRTDATLRKKYMEKKNKDKKAQEKAEKKEKKK